VYHFSEILHLPVLTAEGRRVGRVDDLYADAQDGNVVRLVIRARAGRVELAWDQVESISTDARAVRLAPDAAPTSIAERGGNGETLSLRREILDRQIIDVHGRKVVRVNDILLETVGDALKLRRVETGLAGAVRRLVSGLLRPRTVRSVAAGLAEQGISWDYVGLVDPRSARIQLKVHQQLARMHPADLADIIEDLGRVERQTIVTALDTETAAQALSEVEPAVQSAVVEEIHPEQAADILDEMPPDEAADILGDIGEAQSRAVLDAMEREGADDVRELLEFDEDSAGGLMTTQFFAAGPDWTVGQTLAALRDVDPDLVDELDEIPLVAEDGQLRGIVPLVRLVRVAPDTPLADVCRRETRAVRPDESFEEVVERFEKYNLRALAVVDDGGALAGLISVEDVLSRLATGS
jgi:sporulation protein YlmC with PRC-barrel domain/CBS domain-containing protein